MRVIESGTPAGPPVLLIHGLSSSPSIWDRWLPSLAQRHRVLRADLFAGSTRPFTLERAATELADALRERDAHPAALVAHSMGGLVALHLASGHPALVDRLVLADVPAVPVTLRSRVAQLRGIARGTLDRRSSSLGIVLSCLLRTDPLVLLAATRLTLAADMTRAARESSSSTLLVWGARDAVVPVEVGRCLAVTMPTARLVEIAGAGHQPMWEAPAAFHAAVEPFLSR